MYCYAMNGRCETPAHLWLAGYQGEMQNLLEKTPGYDKWLIEKESRPYIEAFQDQKENLVYLTADSENVLDELDPKKVYIIGGLVDRNRWKGITMNKAKEQGIQTAKLPIGNYLKMSSSQVVFRLMADYASSIHIDKLFLHSAYCNEINSQVMNIDHLLQFTTC